MIASVQSRGPGRGPHWLRALWVLTAILFTLIGCSERARGTAAEADSDGVPSALAAPGPWLADEDLERIIAPLREQVEAGAFPGAAIAVGVADREAHLVGVGAIGWTRNAAPVNAATTVYDLASVTKVVATGTAILLLREEGKLSLDDPAGRFLPEFQTGPKAAVTVRHLLTHTSGLPEGATLRGEGRAARLARARSFPIYPPAGARVVYSDVGYILLGEIIEAAAGEPMPAYLERRLFEPLAMTSTGYAPGLDCEACAPTGRLRDQSLYRGRPFDPLAQRLDGISGHAGLFSTASDLGRFAAMIAADGMLDGIRILSPESVRAFTAPQVSASGFRLAWEEVCPAQVRDDGTPCPFADAIAHTGWTGTSIHIDLETGAWVVILTNRTYEPKVPNPLAAVRRELFARTVEEAKDWRELHNVE